MPKIYSISFLENIFSKLIFPDSTKNIAFSQSVKEISANHLFFQINQNEDPQLVALVFLPADNAHEGSDTPLRALLTYIEEIYAGRIRKRKSKYLIKLWNQYESDVNGEAKANSINEGWRNQFRLLLTKIS